MEKRTIVIETQTKLKEGKIHGKALVPRFSLNGNGYTPEIAEMNDGVCVPIDWNHDRRAAAGDVCFKFDKETQVLNYEGIVKDPEIIAEIKKLKLEGKEMHVSIEGDVYEVAELCNKKKCYNVPIEMKIVRMAITPTPGIPETTLSFQESYHFKEVDLGEIARIHNEMEQIKARLEKVEGLLICPDCGEPQTFAGSNTSVIIPN
jgi:hypothetical protein